MKLSMIISSICLIAASLNVNAQSVLIENAKVHTAGAQGTLDNTNVLIENSRISAIGKDLAAPASATRIDAAGMPVTPGLFAGFTALGLEEISAEPSTVDNGLLHDVPREHETRWRPEFDIVTAYNPRSSVITVNRLEGLTFTTLAPAMLELGSFVTGQGAAVRLDGSFDAAMNGSNSLFIDLGGDSMAFSGGSRAAQYMILQQAIDESRTSNSNGLLTPAGRTALARYTQGGRVVFHVDRAADIRYVIKLSQRYGFKPIIVGGAEAWVMASELAAAKIPVAVDPLVNLPGSFDQLGARLDNAALLHKAGVPVLFTQSGDATHNARKIRQLAGNAVANGMPWEAALAAITSAPAKAFGIANQIGTLAPGMLADVVLWSGDPLEVTSYAKQVWVGGKVIPMRSRQTELRDRYLRNAGELPRQYPAKISP